MPRNTKGGNKAKKGKNAPPTERTLLLREKGQEYGQVVCRLGGNPARIRAIIFSRDPTKPNREMICNIRGKMRKRVWLDRDDLILVALRDFQDNRGDVIHKYKPQERNKLVKQGEIQADDDNDFLEDEDEFQVVPKKIKPKLVANRMSAGLPADLLPSDSEEESEEDGSHQKPSPTGLKSLNNIMSEDIPDVIDLEDI